MSQVLDVRSAEPLVGDDGEAGVDIWAESSTKSVDSLNDRHLRSASARARSASAAARTASRPSRRRSGGSSRPATCRMGYSNDSRIVLSTRTEMHHDVREERRSKLCRNCVRPPREYPQTPTFTGSHREAFCGGKSLNRLREEVVLYHSMRLAGIVFQACLIDRSSISPL